MKPIIVVSTCGTSALLNLQDEPNRRRANAISNLREATAPPDEQAFLQGLAETAQGKLRGANEQMAGEVSAELKAIVALYREQNLRPSRTDQHILVTSDTLAGQLAAQAVQEWLDAWGVGTEVYPITGLVTDNLDNFRHGMAQFLGWFDQRLSGVDRESVTLNLTGGFKSAAAFMQTMGAVYGMECVSIFEHSGQLLRIPRLPLTLNVEQSILDHLTTFRRLAVEGTLPENETRGIPEMLLELAGGLACLSEWGQLFWPKVRAQAYTTGLLPLLSSRLRFTDEKDFQRNVEGVSPDHRRDVNRTLDDLARHLASRGTSNPYNPTSLDFKPLQGNPEPPSTHEADAWSDGGAWRIFSHFEDGGGTLVIDKLGSHLR